MGWAYTSNGMCAKEQGGELSGCSLQRGLFKTTDGGRTWTTLELPRRYNIYLPIVLQNQGQRQVMLVVAL